MLKPLMLPRHHFCAFMTRIVKGHLLALSHYQWVLIRWMLLGEGLEMQIPLVQCHHLNFHLKDHNDWAWQLFYKMHSNYLYFCFFWFERIRKLVSVPKYCDYFICPFCSIKIVLFDILYKNHTYMFIILFTWYSNNIIIIISSVLIQDFPHQRIWSDFVWSLSTPPLKVYLYRTWPRLDDVCEGMIEIKQTKVIYTEHESEHGTWL